MAKIPMVIPNSERNVRNLFTTKELMANEILSPNKPKMIIKKMIMNVTNVPKLFSLNNPEFFQVEKR